MRRRLTRWLTRSKDEEGATLIIVTLATVMLFGFAALAVDVGHGMGERRRAQSTADASVLAAAVEVNLAGATLQDLFDQALLFADANAPSPIPTDDWLNACPDTVNPGEQLEHTAAELGLTPATDCISFNNTFTRMRVSLPQQVVETFFAGVIGIDSFDVTAFAEATMNLTGLGSSPPFVVTAGTSGGDQVCLRTSSSSALLPPQFQGNDTENLTMNLPPVNNPGPGDPLNPDHVDPCDDTVFDPDAQFFGTIKAHTYSDCKQPSGNTGISKVIADGIDHILGSFGDYEIGDTELIDGCSGGIPQPFPNTMELQTGFTSIVLKLGLLSTTATTPRLARGGHSQTIHTFAGEGMDNRPLWTFIRSDIGNTVNVKVPTACRTVYAKKDNGNYDYFDLKELMVTCLENFSNQEDEDNVIFDATILASARFAWIPIIDEDALVGLDKKKIHINAFVPIFIHKLYQQGKAVGSPDPFCFAQHPDEKNTGWYMHEAGQETGACGRSNQNVDRVGAIILHCASVPDTVCIDDTTSDNPGGRPVFRLELVK